MKKEDRDEVEEICRKKIEDKLFEYAKLENWIFEHFKNIKNFTDFLDEVASKHYTGAE